MSDKNMTKIEAALARAEKALAEAREASARTDQAIDRAQEAIDRFWANQEKALARMRGKEEKTEAKAADSASCECSCRDSGSRQEIDFYRADALKSRADALRMTGTQIDPDLLVDIVSDLLQLAGRMNERILTIERRTKRRLRKRRIAGYFVPPAF